ncbi:MAG TPA: hypothetical protein PLO20_15565 [Thermogutta sp.]|nr:hypothetical protein [Thermogutta sp.]
MFEPLIVLTVLVLATAWLIAYGRCRDALHPLIYIAPLMAFQYAVRPWQLYQQGELQRLLQESWMLELSAFVHFLGVTAFCVGCVPPKRTLSAPALWRTFMTPAAKRNLVRLAVGLGCISTFFYYYSIIGVGGLAVAYGRPKGGGLRLASGYFGEAIGLCVPAVVLLLMAWRKDKLRLQHFGLITFLASPYLLTGFLGSRRGPTFMILGAMVFTWFLVRRSRTSVWRVVSSVFLISLVVVFLFTNRPRLYLGSPEPIDWSAPWRFLTGKTGASEGDDYVVATANVVVYSQTGKYHWGRRMITTFLIRPIPKQLWPGKYQDAKKLMYSEQELVTSEDYQELLGWIPSTGSAIGGVADLFTEFSWGCVVAMYLYGWFYRFIWQKARLQQGVWMILYIIAASLCIYIPTQSMSAVFHRFLFLSVPLTALWWTFVGPLTHRIPITGRRGFSRTIHLSHPLVRSGTQ